MNLYLLAQNKNNGYDAFDSMVIAAENEAVFSYDGKRISNLTTENYKPYEWECEFINEWAEKAYKTLEG